MIQADRRYTAAPKLFVLCRFCPMWTGNAPSTQAVPAPCSKRPVMDHVATYLLLGRTTRVMRQSWLASLIFIITRFTNHVPKFLILILASIINVLIRRINNFVRTKNATSSNNRLNSSNIKWTYNWDLSYLGPVCRAKPDASGLYPGPGGFSIQTSIS